MPPDPSDRAADERRLAEIRADVHAIASALTPEPRDAIQGIVRFLLRFLDDARAELAQVTQQRDLLRAELPGLREQCERREARYKELMAECEAELARLRNPPQEALTAGDLIARWAMQTPSLKNIAQSDWDNLKAHIINALTAARREALRSAEEAIDEAWRDGPDYPAIMRAIRSLAQGGE